MISHFSQRYPDETILLDEAGAEFDDVIAAHDFLRRAGPLTPGARPQTRAGFLVARTEA